MVISNAFKIAKTMQSATMLCKATANSKNRTGIEIICLPLKTDFKSRVPCSILLNGNCSPSLQKKGDLFKNHWLLIKFSKAKAIHYSAHLSSHPLLLEQKKNSRPRQRKIATAEE